MKQKERLDKILSHIGYGSRKEVRALIKNKKVYVNDQLATDNGLHVTPDIDLINVDGETINYREFIYVMMNKPQGVISATEDHKDRTVIDILDQSLQHFKPFPVGRLDKDTEGLLLITNDGKLAHQLLSPKKQVDKTYYVEVLGELSEQDRLSFSQGVTLDDGYLTLPAKLNILQSGLSSKAELTIVEGKFHQVKRMMKSIGKQVTFLKRMRMGPLKLDPNLPVGQYRELNEEELLQLKAMMKE